MSFISDFLRELPLYLLSLPVILMSLCVHEAAHGYVAWKLGDPTARNLGRLTLNPAKHLDLVGTLCMIFFHIGWAKPVPINARNFKNPRRDMALSAAAGPISNLLMAVIHLALLLLGMMWANSYLEEEAYAYVISIVEETEFSGSLTFTVAALLTYILYLGVELNIFLALFNLIPVPPFDGSRIFYVFLPTKWYFGVMKYERYIMIGFIVLFFIVSRAGLLNGITSGIIDGLFTLVGLNKNLSWVNGSMLDILLIYVTKLAA